MTQQETSPRFPRGSRLDDSGTFTPEELQLAFRNRGMPLEALRYPITPTGMHYLVIHFDVPEVNAATWQLKIGGLVSKELTLDLDAIRARPAITLAVTMECAGNGRALLSPRPVSQPWLIEAVGTAEWTGTPLCGVLEEAGIVEGSVEAVFTGLDRGVQGEDVHYYQRSLTIDEATRPEVLLAYEMNGAPLEPQHGYPLRLLVPGWYGMTSVKWLDRIEVVAEPFNGYQMGTYTCRQTRDEAGVPVDLVRVRALMVPPGIPDFYTRGRLVEAGPVTLTGRAWAGRASIQRVEVSTDGGATWSDAALDHEVPPHAWRGWSFAWDAEPGPRTLSVRATDDADNVQPIDQWWTVSGIGNNMAQRVSVIVEAGELS